MDSALSNALRSRDKLLKRLAEIQRQLETVDHFLSLYERFNTSPQFELPDMDKPLVETVEQKGVEQIEDVAEVPATPLRKRGMSREALRPHIREALKQAGKPLTRGQLLRAMDQREIPVGGATDRSKNMGTIMWRLKDEFVNLDGFGYWPISEPYQPAGYSPEVTSEDPKASSNQPIIGGHREA